MSRKPSIERGEKIFFLQTSGLWRGFNTETQGAVRGDFLTQRSQSGRWFFDRIYRIIRIEGRRFL